MRTLQESASGFPCRRDPFFAYGKLIENKEGAGCVRALSELLSGLRAWLLQMVDVRRSRIGRAGVGARRHRHYDVFPLLVINPFYSQ